MLLISLPSRSLASFPAQFHRCITCRSSLHGGCGLDSDGKRLTTVCLSDPADHRGSLMRRCAIPALHRQPPPGAPLPLEGRQPGANAILRRAPHCCVAPAAPCAGAGASLTVLPLTCRCSAGPSLNRKPAAPPETRPSPTPSRHGCWLQRPRPSPAGVRARRTAVSQDLVIVSEEEVMRMPGAVVPPLLVRSGEITEHDLSRCPEEWLVQSWRYPEAVLPALEPLLARRRSQAGALPHSTDTMHVGIRGFLLEQ